VKLLLLFLFATFFIAMRAAKRGKPSRAWVLAGACFFVAVLFTSPRVL
jgi:hypothetical protein